MNKGDMTFNATINSVRSLGRRDPTDVLLLITRGRLLRLRDRPRRLDSGHIFADKGDALTWFRLRFNWLAVTYVDPDLQDCYEGYNDLGHVPVRLKQAWVERTHAGAQLPGGQVRIGDSPLGRPA